uniref:Uncharacterized protein n=1 Tax=Brassica oleracea TaxID=3712 RepID=A0A3P6CVQ3_BRAOL|nr:unnamed protein product [Brassica oleracea]
MYASPLSIRVRNHSRRVSTTLALFFLNVCFLMNRDW